MALEGKAVWIGLVEVRSDATHPDPALPDGKAAFVSVVAYVKDESEFRTLVAESLLEIGLCLEGVEELQPYDERTREYEVEQTLQEEAKRVLIEGGVGYGTFHTYDPQKQ